MNTHKNKTIALVGMMGAGKSHIGKELAKKLDLECIDSDRVIEEKAGMSVFDIFEKFGEAKFRDSEHRTILEVIGGPQCVLSTGGGALMNEDTLSALKAHATVVWIDAPLNTIWKRVKGSDRPLLQKPDAHAALEALIEQRKHLYAQAHIHVQNDNDQTSRAVQEIINALPACP